MVSLQEDNCRANEIVWMVRSKNFQSLDDAMGSPTSNGTFRIIMIGSDSCKDHFGVLQAAGDELGVANIANVNGSLGR